MHSSTMERSCSLQLYHFFLIISLFSCVVGVWEEPGRHPYVDPVDRQQPWTSIRLSVILEPGREECFFQRVREGIKFQLGYHATSKDVHQNLRVTVKSERGERLYASYIKLEDDFETQVNRDALYSICFGNQGSRRYAKKVTMSIHMIEEEKLREYFRLKEETEGHLVNASQSLHRTWNHMWRISREQFRLRFATQRDEEFMANNADYILYWSIAQAIIIVTAGIVQVWTLRSFFNVKVLTPSQKPRC